jgi:glutamate dehydrogenase
MLLGVIEIADRMSLDPVQVARLHFALGERLGLPDLVTRILALPREDRWQTMARAALRDDVYAVHAQLTAQVLRDTSAEESVPARIAEWEDGDAVVVHRAASILQEICKDDNADLARMSVGLRVVRGLLAN